MPKILKKSNFFRCILTSMTIIIVRRAQKGSGQHEIVIIPSFQFRELSIPTTFYVMKPDHVPMVHSKFSPGTINV